MYSSILLLLDPMFGHLICQHEYLQQRASTSGGEDHLSKR